MKVMPLILSVLLMLACTALPSQSAPLLDSLLSNASKHDFITHFQFKEQKAAPGSTSNDGLTDHLLLSKSSNCMLILGVDKTGKVERMSLGVPRVMLDQDKTAISGREIVKNFVLAVGMNPVEQTSLKAIAREISDGKTKPSAHPSPFLLVVLGKSDEASGILQKCRIGFRNTKAHGGTPAILWCEAWNEAFVQTNKFWQRNR